MLPFVFDLPESSLKMVLNEEQIQQMKVSLINACLIGIDTETKPTFVPRHQMVGGPHPTSIIQIAVRGPKSKEEVFVVDMLHISKNSKLMATLDIALQQGLLENQCFKLGQGLTNDLRELAEAYPNVKAFRLVNCVLETHDLMKYMKPVLTNPISLKNLVKEYLHLNLLKTEQMSNWAKRPLTSQQLHYAACDALVLLRLYDAICYEIEDKLSVAGDASASESEADVASAFSTTASATSSSSSASVKDTLQGLCRTVDYIGQDFSRKAVAKRNQRHAAYGHKQDIALRHPESSLLNNSLLRGWQSQPAKQWLKTQAGAVSGNSSTGKRGADGSEHESKRPRRNSFGSQHGDDEDNVRIPLPAGTGRHVVFTTPGL